MNSASQNNDRTEICALHLTPSLEASNSLKWIAETSKVIKEMGALSIVPGRIGRAEPLLRQAGGKVIEEPLDKPKSGMFNRLVQIAKEKQAAAYLCYDISMIALAKKLQAKAKAPIIAVVLDYIPKTRKLGVMKPKSPFLGVDFIIVPSQALAKQLQADWDIPAVKIKIIMEGIDIDTVSEERISQARTFSLAETWSAIENPTELVLLQANYSSPIWRKHFIDLITEWSSRKRPPMNFIVVGSDDGSGELNKLHAKLSGKKFHTPQFVGHCADIEAALKLSCCLIELPSMPKAMHPSAILAQAIGRFVVLPEEASAFEFLPDAQSTGLISSDPKVICDHLEELLTGDEFHRRTVAQIARNFVGQKFTLEMMSSDLQTLFQNGE